MNGVSSINTILLSILITIIFLAILGVIDFSPVEKTKRTTYIYPQKNVVVSQPFVDIAPYYHRPRRFIYPKRYLRPFARKRMRNQ